MVLFKGANGAFFSAEADRESGCKVVYRDVIQADWAVSKVLTDCG